MAVDVDRRDGDLGGDVGGGVLVETREGLHASGVAVDPRTDGDRGDRGSREADAGCETRDGDESSGDEDGEETETEETHDYAPGIESLPQPCGETGHPTRDWL